MFFLYTIYILQPRYSHVQHINLEFAQTIEDQHLIILKEVFYNWI